MEVEAHLRNKIVWDISLIIFVLAEAILLLFHFQIFLGIFFLTLFEGFHGKTTSIFLGVLI
jgi:hypothetical protein